MGTLNLFQTQKVSQHQIMKSEILYMNTDELLEKIKEEASINPALIIKGRDDWDEYNETTDIDDDWCGEEYEEPTGGGPAYTESLQDHLLSQLGLMTLNEPILHKAENLISRIDDNGFVTLSEEEKEDGEYLAALAAIQSMDPSGIGASSWKESLIIQAEREGLEGRDLSLMKQIIDTELENLRDNKLGKIALRLRSDIPTIERIANILKSLTLFPGSSYGADFRHYIVPEISIKKTEGNKLSITLSDDLLPVIMVDPEFEKLRTQSGGERSEWKTIDSKIREASEFVSLVESRKSLLAKLAVFLSERQRDFFIYGPLYLKGLTMVETAECLSVSEATISRAANDKYVDTDFGVFSLRNFFSAGSLNTAKSAVKEIILGMINDSDKKLSDREIAEALNGMGIEIARRTVTKYRNELGMGK